jgi:hypothetical protein
VEVPPFGTSEDQTVFAWAFRFFLVAKIDGHVERLNLEKTTGSHSQAGSWRNGDRIRRNSPLNELPLCWI